MVREEGLDTLGKTIRFYRKKAGMTQEQLAEKIYTKKSDISEIENDKRSIAIPKLLDIAEALNVHPAKMFSYINQGEDEKRRSVYRDVLDEIEKLEDMELVGMVLQFVQMLKNSTYNKIIYTK